MSQPSIFLSYASEDHEFVESLSTALSTLGVTAWYAHDELELGESIVEKIDNAMNSIRLALLIISPAFLAKAWPLREFRALTALGLKDNERRLIPILHGVSDQSFLKVAPMMADIKWISSERGLDFIVCSLRIILAEPANRSLPRQQVVVEEKGKITQFDTLAKALNHALDNALVVLYPGEYTAPLKINKSVSIIARGPARDTIVRIPEQETMRITASNFELDGVSLLAGAASKPSDPKKEDYEVFRSSGYYPCVNRGDAMITVSRHAGGGQIVLKNCFIDAMNRFRLIIATDARVQIRNSNLKNSKSGLNARNEGRIELVACTLNNVNAEVEQRASLLVSDSIVTSCLLTTQHNGKIEISKSEFYNSAAHAYSEGKISISHRSIFKNFRQKGGIPSISVYGTHYSHVRVEDSRFEDCNCALYVSTGSLLFAHSVIIIKSESCGIRYSEGCTGDVEDCEILECLGQGIQLRKGANPQIRRCLIEENGGVGIASEMSSLNIHDCKLSRNRQGGILVDTASMTITGTRVLLNDGPGISIRDVEKLEIFDCEIGHNKHGQLLIGGMHWYPPVTLLQRLIGFFVRRLNIRISRTALY